jgi:hypothetical protein
LRPDWFAGMAMAYRFDSPIVDGTCTASVSIHSDSGGRLVARFDIREARGLLSPFLSN